MADVWRRARPVLAVALSVVVTIAAYASDAAASSPVWLLAALLVPSPAVCFLFYLPRPQRAVVPALIAYGSLVLVIGVVAVYAAGHGH